MAVRESTIEANNGKFAKDLRIIFRKLNFGEGWPDRILLYRGRVVFIEYKAPGERPTALQTYTHELLRKQGFEVHVIDNSEEGRKLIKDWHDRIDQYMATFRGDHDQDQRSGPDVRSNPWTLQNKTGRLGR